MVLAVEHGSPYVDHRVARGAPVGHGVDDASFYGGDELPGDHSAPHLVGELKTRPGGQWLDPDRRDTELPVAAALLLVLAFGTEGAGDGLPVSHPGVLFVDLDTEPCDPSILRRIPEALLTGRHVAPFGETGGEVLLATADPDDQQVITAINRHLSATSRIVIADPDAIVRFLQRAIRSPRSSDESTDAADVVAMLETILKEA